MIRIEITDPHLMDAEVLAKTGVYLMQLAGKYIVPAPQAVQPPVQKAVQPAEPIAPLAPFAPPLVTDCVPAHPEAESTVPQEFNPFANSGIELDANGLPWDARIHSRTKSRNSDGSWKVQRGADPIIVLQVTNELRQTMQAPTVQSMEIPTPVPMPEDTLEVPPVPEVIDFEKLMRSITDSIKAGKLKHFDVMTACGIVDLPTPAALANRPDLVPTVYKALEKFFN